MTTDLPEGTSAASSGGVLVNPAPSRLPVGSGEKPTPVSAQTPPPVPEPAEPVTPEAINAMIEDGVLTGQVTPESTETVGPVVPLGEQLDALKRTAESPEDEDEPEPEPPRLRVVEPSSEWDPF